MKYKIWAGVVIFFLTGQLASAISPEAARKELAQENIPYTAEALFAYVDKGATDVVGWFLAIGMDVNVKNEFGETALMNAAEQGHLDRSAFVLARTRVPAGQAWAVVPPWPRATVKRPFANWEAATSIRTISR